MHAVDFLDPSEFLSNTFRSAAQRRVTAAAFMRACVRKIPLRTRTRLMNAAPRRATAVVVERACVRTTPRRTRDRRKNAVLRRTTTAVRCSYKLAFARRRKNLRLMKKRGSMTHDSSSVRASLHSHDATDHPRSKTYRSSTTRDSSGAALVRACVRTTRISSGHRWSLLSHVTTEDPRSMKKRGSTTRGSSSHLASLRSHDTTEDPCSMKKRGFTTRDSSGVCTSLRSHDATKDPDSIKRRKNMTYSRLKFRWPILMYRALVASRPRFVKFARRGRATDAPGFGALLPSKRSFTQWPLAALSCYLPALLRVLLLVRVVFCAAADHALL